jgi:hypothetical protein
MEDLSRKLRKNGFDMIDGISREHRVLQIWKKKMGDVAQLSFGDINKAFSNPDKVLTISKANALDAVSDASKEFKFNIGASVLEDLLAQAKLGELGLNSKIEKGKKVTISFSDAYTEQVENGELTEYFHGADVLPNSPAFLKDLNRDNFIVITTVLFAKNLKAEIESESKISADLDAKVNGIVGGKLSLVRNSDSKVTLNARVGEDFPIAVKFSKIKYDNSTFDNLIQVSDSKDWF